MESGDCGGCCDVIMRHPHVFASVVALPFHQVLQSVVTHATIEDFFDFVVFVTVYKDWIGGRSSSATRDRVRRGGGQLYDREDGVKSLERRRELETIRVATYASFDRVRT